MDVINALLEMEQKAESSLATIQREKDKLPARIAAETSHVRQLISQEMTTAIKKMQEESSIATALRIQAIEEASSKQLADLQSEFDTHKESLRAELFQRLTKWNTLP